MAGNFQPAKLDVDPTILDSNLMVVDQPEDPFSSLFPTSSTKNHSLDKLLPGAQYDSKSVIPKPGMCVKTKNAAGTKFFINLCKLAEIPAPPPIEESELSRIISSEDYTSPWRVPMSLGIPRKEKDKSGGECFAAEIAVNSSWFENTVVHSDIVLSFVLTIAMEGLCEKHGEDARLDRNNWTVLKNKKFMGEVDKCPPHNIQIRQTSGIEHIEESSAKSLISKSSSKKLDNSTNNLSTKKSIIEVLPDESEGKTTKEIEPKYRIMKDPINKPVQLKCRVMLPGVNSAKEVVLDVGEDRLVVTCSKTHHLLDIFLPHTLDADNTSASFVMEEHVLNINIPLL